MLGILFLRNRSWTK